MKYPTSFRRPNHSLRMENNFEASAVTVFGREDVKYDVPKSDTPG